MESEEISRHRIGSAGTYLSTVREDPRERFMRHPVGIGRCSPALKTHLAHIHAYVPAARKLEEEKVDGRIRRAFLHLSSYTPLIFFVHDTIFVLSSRFFFSAFSISVHFCRRCLISSSLLTLAIALCLVPNNSLEAIIGCSTEFAVSFIKSLCVGDESIATQ